MVIVLRSAQAKFVKLLLHTCRSIFFHLFFTVYEDPKTWTIIQVRKQIQVAEKTQGSRRIQTWKQVAGEQNRLTKQNWR